MFALSYMIENYFILLYNIKKGGVLMLKQKVFNYITVIFAILTIALAITSNNYVYSIISLILTLIVGFFSRKFNNEVTKLTKKDKEFLENTKYIQNDREIVKKELRKKVDAYKKRRYLK